MAAGVDTARDQSSSTNTNKQQNTCVFRMWILILLVTNRPCGIHREGAVLIVELTNIFVVYDPIRETQPAFIRACAIAERIAVRIHVFACIHTEIPESEGRPARISSLLTQQKEGLDFITSSLLAQGIEVTTEVEWDKDWYQAVVRACVRNNADVVLKSSFKHRPRQRVLQKTSDWTLLRECPCPVLLVKENSSRDMRKVLAAIDIRNDKGTYQALNRNIVDFSQKVLDINDAEVHFINAFQGLQASPDRKALARYCGVDVDRIHIQKGGADDVIVAGAKNLNANLVVVGNAARSGLAAMLRGNTVEKVLDRLRCDILSMP
jgi:universal stress protein E